MYNSYGYNPYNRYATQPLTAQLWKLWKKNER